MSVRWKGLGALSGFVISLFTGCESAPKQLQLSYANSPSPNEGVVRLATGTALDVLVGVADAQKRYSVRLTEVSASDDEVAAASLMNGDVRVEAKASGRSTILIKGIISPGEQAAHQELEIEVVDAASLKLAHRCGLVAAPLYLTGQRVHVGLTRYDAQGGVLQGYGPAPLTLSSGAKVEAHRGLEPGVAFETGEVVGELVLRSMLDPASLTLTVVSLTQIDGASLDGVRELKVGEHESFYLMPAVNARPICQAKLKFEVENLSMSICDVVLDSELLGELVEEDNLVSIEAHGAGICRFKTTITIPGVAAPVTTMHELVIKEASAL